MFEGTTKIAPLLRKNYFAIGGEDGHPQERRMKLFLIAVMDETRESRNPSSKLSTGLRRDADRTIKQLEVGRRLGYLCPRNCCRKTVVLLKSSRQTWTGCMVGGGVTISALAC